MMLFRWLNNSRASLYNIVHPSDSQEADQAVKGNPASQ